MCLVADCKGSVLKIERCTCTALGVWGLKLKTLASPSITDGFWDQNTMHSLVFLHSLPLFAAFLFTCVVDGSMSALPAPNLRSSSKRKKKNPACTPVSQEPHCWSSKHRQGCDIAWLLCDYWMAGIKDEVADMWRHSQLNQCVQFSFYVNRAAYKSARLNKLIIFLCNTVNILNLEYYKNCPSGIKKDH